MVEPGESARYAHGVREAEVAYGELRLALAECGVVLPSLALDLPAPRSLVPVPLIDLGRCNTATARSLAARLRTAAAFPGAGRG